MTDAIELTTVDENGNHNSKIFAYDVIAAWGELLGLTDPAQIISVMTYVMDNGEPPVDPETGATVWAKAYQALAIRESARLEEIKTAEREGTTSDPRSPALRGALAAAQVKPEVRALQQEVLQSLVPAQITNVVPALPLTANSLKSEREAFVKDIQSMIVV